MTRPTVPKNGMAHAEWAFSAFEGSSQDPNIMLHVVVNLFAYVRGCATNVDMELESVQDTGLTEDEWLEPQGEQFARVLASGAMHSSHDLCGADVELDVDMLFEFGLERLLDGNAALIQTRDSSTHV